MESDDCQHTLRNHFHPSLIERLKFYDSEMKVKIAARSSENVYRSEGNRSDGFGLRNGNHDGFEKNGYLNSEYRSALGAGAESPHSERCQSKDTGSSDQSSWLTDMFIESRLEDSAKCGTGQTTKESHERAKATRNRLKSMVLSRNYQNGLPELKRQNVIATTDGKDQETIVKLGQKSSVFALGLILVELFGGLRTGLTALCHFPVVTNWFSKEFAYELIELDYQCQDEQDPHALINQNFTKNLLKAPPNVKTSQNGQKDTQECGEEKNISRRATRSLPSFPPYSGTSDKRVDYEFRIIMDWDAKLIPVSPNSESLYDLQTLRALHKQSGRKGSKAISAAAKAVELKSFKELYKQYCYPFEGCLATNWVVNQSESRTMSSATAAAPLKGESDESSDGRGGKRSLELPVGQLIERILDKCLQYDPTKRPTYATLKRMLHGLRLILWNIRNDAIINRWKKSQSCCRVEDIDVAIDDLGYVEISGSVCENNDSIEGKKARRKTTLLKTISRRGYSNSRFVDANNRELILDVLAD